MMHVEEPTDVLGSVDGKEIPQDSSLTSSLFTLSSSAQDPPPSAQTVKCQRMLVMSEELTRQWWAVVMETASRHRVRWEPDQPLKLSRSACCKICSLSISKFYTLTCKVSIQIYETLTTVQRSTVKRASALKVKFYWMGWELNSAQLDSHRDSTKPILPSNADVFIC